MNNSQVLLQRLRDGLPLNVREQAELTLRLSVPSILAQLSTVIMQYIDASMVGQLGADASAAIGLVSSSTWLINGLCNAIVIGFTVLTAQAVGAKDLPRARNLVKEALTVPMLFSAVMALLGLAVSKSLPVWLGGHGVVCEYASAYFLFYTLALPARQLVNTAAGLLQADGDMRTPGAFHVLMCALDVLFNGLLIPEAVTLRLPTGTLTIPGAGMGAAGAALGTGLAELTAGLILTGILFFRSPDLKLRKGEQLILRKEDLTRAVRISVPVAVQQATLSGAHILSTRIVSPLGNISIAANSFSVTAESLCYMPGFGVATAATTLIGQCIGAGRRDVVRRLGWTAVLLGMALMGLTGALMYLSAPLMIGFLSPVAEIRELSTEILRIEAFAEPLYAASIVVTGVLRGAGDTLIPGLLNLISMWCVRLPLAAVLAPRAGLRGVWIAMAIELCFRGILFLWRLKSGRWLQKAFSIQHESGKGETAV